MPNPIKPQIRKDGTVFMMNSPTHIVLPRRAHDQVLCGQIALAKAALSSDGLARALSF
jgi:hypothetical protein